ncbi:MAG: hypothetical protein LBH84_09525 [Prevotellaceae bacterium]|jgi:hypothetical protein|nr:hypothetical protein [Prevotellaceae bacterium]
MLSYYGNGFRVVLQLVFQENIFFNNRNVCSENKNSYICRVNATAKTPVAAFGATLPWPDSRTAQGKPDDVVFQLFAESFGNLCDELVSGCTAFEGRGF